MELVSQRDCECVKMVQPRLVRPAHSQTRCRRVAQSWAALVFRDDKRPKCCQHVLMTRSDLARILLNAPAWARVGLTVRDERLRERAADTLAAIVVEKLTPSEEADPRQLCLPIA